MNTFRKRELPLFCLWLSSCTSPAVVEQDRLIEVAVPVHAACATARPPVPLALRARYTEDQWAALDVRQKAAAVGAAGLDRLTYGEQLHAATAACPEAPAPR